MSSAICLNLDESKILSSGNGLNSLFRKSLKAYDGTPCLPCCIMGLFWGKLRF